MEYVQTDCSLEQPIQRYCQNKIQPELLLVGYLEDKLIASVMAGYDGHRGYINYFAVHPDFQARGYGSSS